VSGRGAPLADEFIQRFATIEELLRSLTDEQWRLPCAVRAGLSQGLRFVYRVKDCRAP
jgi:hypothetical protein